MKEHTSIHSECNHNPADSDSKIKRIWQFFIHKRELLDTQTNTSSCSKCNCYLRVPAMYTHFATKLLYMMISFILVSSFYILTSLLSSLLSLEPDWKFYYILVTLGLGALLLYVAHRLITAIILSCCKWEIQEQKNELLIIEENKAKQHASQKLAAIATGMSLATLLFKLYLYLWK